MKHPIRRRLMYFGFQVLRAVTEPLPRALLHPLGRGLGLVAYSLLGTHRRLTEQHLREAMGSTLSPGECRKIARKVFVHLGQNTAEWLQLPRYSLADIQKLVEAQGLEHVREALSKGNGAVMISAHFGNWEMVPLYLRSLGLEGGVLARRLRYSEYESFLISMRGAHGIPTFARGSVKDVARLLHANQIVGVLLDQDVDSLEGVFVDFFGKMAYTPAGPAALSLMTKAPLIPCFIIREGSKFRFIVEPPIEPQQRVDRELALMQMTQAWTDVLMRYIRRYPDQWVWMHRRWKTQPPPPANDSTQHTAHSTQKDSTQHIAISNQQSADSRQRIADSTQSRFEVQSSKLEGEENSGVGTDSTLYAKRSTLVTSDERRTDSTQYPACRFEGNQIRKAQSAIRKSSFTSHLSLLTWPLLLILVTCHLSLVTSLGGCSKPQASSQPLKTQGSSVELVTERDVEKGSDSEQKMQGFNLTGYESDGTKKWELDGEQAHIDGEIVTVQQPDAVGYDSKRTSYIRAELARVNRATKRVRMENQVVMHTSDGIWLTSPLLHWVPDEKRIKTNQPIRIETNRMLLRGRGAIGLTDMKRATLIRDVEMVYSLSGEPSTRMSPLGRRRDSSSPKPRSGHIRITCDGPMIVDDASALATFEHNVHVQDPSGDLYSDLVVAYFEKDTWAIRYAEAIGHVQLVKEGNTAWSQKAIYDPLRGTMTLAGSSSLALRPSTFSDQKKKGEGIFGITNTPPKQSQNNP